MLRRDPLEGRGICCDIAVHPSFRGVRGRRLGGELRNETVQLRQSMIPYPLSPLTRDPQWPGVLDMPVEVECKRWSRRKQVQNFQSPD